MRKLPSFILVTLAFSMSLSLLFAQDVKGKSLFEKPINAKYLDVGKKEYMLVFYGYVGCVKVCSPVLDNLNRFYSSDSFIKFEPFVDLIFVNLLPKLSQEQPDQYAKSFNPKFIGVYLTQKELKGIDKELNLYFSNRADDLFELDHSDHIYLIKREKNGNLTLINTYTTHPLNQTLIVDDLSEYTRASH
jgi:protein SCO1/2